MKKYDANQIAAVTGAQVKIPLILDEQGDFIVDSQYKYTLKRLDDGLTKRGNSIKYIEWNEDKSSKEMHDEASIGYSLILDPSMNFTWLTTTIVEILKQKDKYIKFKTENSTYELVQHF
jgi:hypothetical protein